MAGSAAPSPFEKGEVFSIACGPGVGGGDLLEFQQIFFAGNVQDVGADPNADRALADRHGSDGEVEQQIDAQAGASVVESGIRRPIDLQPRQRHPSIRDRGSHVPLGRQAEHQGEMSLGQQTNDLRQLCARRGDERVARRVKRPRNLSTDNLNALPMAKAKYV